VNAEFAELADAATAELTVPPTPAPPAFLGPRLHHLSIIRIIGSEHHDSPDAPLERARDLPALASQLARLPGLRALHLNHLSEDECSGLPSIIQLTALTRLELASCALGPCAHALALRLPAYTLTRRALTHTICAAYSPSAPVAAVWDVCACDGRVPKEECRLCKKGQNPFDCTRCSARHAAAPCTCTPR
jgi:hypothetical protein